MAKGLKDIYCNFFTIQVDTAAVATTLVTHHENTAAGPSTNTGWIISAIEWFFAGDYISGTGRLTAALSTRRDLTTMPSLNDKGCVSRFDEMGDVHASGAFLMQQPKMVVFPVPLIIAPSVISIYAQCSTNIASLQSEAVIARIHYLTEALSPAIYQELYQTWNFAS